MQTIVPSRNRCYYYLTAGCSKRDRTQDFQFRSRQIFINAAMPNETLSLGNIAFYTSKEKLLLQLLDNRLLETESNLGPQIWVHLYIYWCNNSKSKPFYYCLTTGCAKRDRTQDFWFRSRQIIIKAAEWDTFT